MGLALFSGPDTGRRESIRTKYSRLQVESLEDRVTPASAALPLAVEGINVVGAPGNQSLQAVVSLAGQAATPVTMDLTTTAATEPCQVLNLHLGPIDLDLLGLHVVTSEICLDITGDPNGGLLGQLVCGLADGLNLNQIITSLGNQLNGLLGQLDNLLDQALGHAMTVTGVLGSPSGGVTAQQTPGECDILNLSLGPVDLNLLGLGVHLDNCDNGPVTVDVTGVHGELLGDLLCGLSEGNLGGINLGRLIGRIDNLIDRLTDLAGRLDKLPDLGHLAQRVDRLIDRLEDLVDRIGDVKAGHLIHQVDHFIHELDHVIHQLDKIIARL